MGFYAIFIDRTVETTGNHWEERGNGTDKGPRDGIRTRVAVSTVALYVDALTTKLLAPTHLLLFYLKNKYIIL